MSFGLFLHLCQEKVKQNLSLLFNLIILSNLTSSNAFCRIQTSCFSFDGALHAGRQNSYSVVVKSLSENGKSYLKNYFQVIVQVL